jgi:hypothetical protein
MRRTTRKRNTKRFVANFDHLSKSAWNTLNTSWYTKLSSRKQYEASWDAQAAVEKCIQAIADRAYATSSYGTKLSALETLRKIAKTVLLTKDTLGYEVRKQFQYETILADTMLAIAESMTEDEQLRAGENNPDGKGTLSSKLNRVAHETRSLSIDGLDVSQAAALLDPGDELGEE